MRCPQCTSDETSVLGSRETFSDKVIRRRRKCNTCAHRWSTVELPEEVVAPLIDFARVTLRPVKEGRKRALFVPPHQEKEYQRLKRKGMTIPEIAQALNLTYRVPT